MDTILSSCVEAGVGFVHLHVHSCLFPARRRDGDRQARQARRRRQNAGAGDHRHQQSVRRARILRKARQGRMQPIAGLQIALDFGDGAAMAPRGEDSGAGARSIVLLAYNEAGYLTLCISPLAPGSIRPRATTPHVALARLDGRTSGPHRALRRPRRPARPRLRARPARTGAAARRNGSRRCFRTASTSSCSAMACQASARPSRASSISPIAASLPLVATNEAYFAAAPTMRRMTR